MALVQQGPAAAWSVFDGWSPLRSAQRASGWLLLDGWMELSAKAAEGEETGVQKLLEEWNEKLSLKGGNPSSRDRSSFPPLRREEDWSDWLAELLRSHTPFAQILFQRHPKVDLKVDLVEREVPVGNRQRRVDLVLTWSDQSRSSVEVKVGDEAFEKTFQTNELAELDAARPGQWTHWILLPSDAVEDWNELAAQHESSGVHIETRTWEDVAIALRRCLWSTPLFSPDMIWLAAMCGAVEQRILDLPHTDSNHGGQAKAFDSERLRIAVARRGILEKGKEP